jgi:hypothetical protein
MASGFEAHGFQPRPRVIVATVGDQVVDELGDAALLSRAT